MDVVEAFFPQVDDVHPGMMMTWRELLTALENAGNDYFQGREPTKATRTLADTLVKQAEHNQ